MTIGIYTSSRATSLRKVSEHLAKVLSEAGIETAIFTSPMVDEKTYSLDGAIVVMPVDKAFCNTYFYLCYRVKSLGKPALYYGTIEGDIKLKEFYDWIRREIDFVANSKYTAKKLQSAKYRVLDIIYHGVDTSFYSDTNRYRELARRELGIGENDFVVGYIASTAKRKGHFLAARVIELIEKADPSVKFLIVSGADTAEYYRNLKNVIFISKFGSLSEESVKALYSAMDLYSQFSLSEGFGLPVLEALAAGRPVVHADYEPLSEITTLDTSFRVRVTSIEYYEDYSGIRFELHLYDPVEYAEVILQAKEILQSPDREILEDLARHRAMEFDMYKTYSQFTKLLLKEQSLFI